MQYIRAKVKIYKSGIKAEHERAKNAALLTMQELQQDVVASGTMPYDTGEMQDKQTFCAVEEDGKTITASLVTGSPQARRLYTHPEYNFTKTHNASAGGGWLEPYQDGEFIKSKYAELMRREHK